MKLFILLLIFTLNVQAKVIGQVMAKGLFVKATITVKSFKDPDIKGITCYTTEYKRGISFTSSTNSSLSCRQTGKITGKLKARKNIFVQKKGFLFSKNTVVDRMIDLDNNVIIYLSYTKSIGDKNTSHSISVVPIKKW